MPNRNANAPFVDVVTKRTTWGWILNRLTMFVGCAGIVFQLGCSPTYEPIDRSLAEQIKSSSSFEDAKQLLGQPHPPTSYQMSRLQGVYDRMRPATKKNAEADASYAWGSDEGFLAVTVNEEGVIWVTSNGFGTPRSR
jgi:hypothetical protein